MKYGFGLALLFSLAMTFAAPAPQCYWWGAAGAGIFLNALAIGANHWKMPVKGGCPEGPRHQSMTADTRFKWLADVIPTGLGKASLGDFAICAGVLGIAANRGQITLAMALVAAWLLPWMSGCGGGLRIFEKWTREERRDARKNIPIAVTLLIIGNLIGLHGCSGPELMASVERARDVVTPAGKIHSPKTRLLAKLAMSPTGVVPPPFEILKRLREDDAKRAPELKKQAARDAVNEVNQWVQPLRSGSAFTAAAWNNYIAATKPIEHDQRKGPFCRVTCSVHHGNIYDVETDERLCKANWIPPDTDTVPGWITQGQFDYRNPWPGPATPGFHTYKLYWAKATKP